MLRTHDSRGGCVGDDERLNQLIVIGSSAGGIDALSVVVSKLPADMPVPIIVAQHLDPRRPSHLVGILQRRTALRVEEVEDSAKLEPGRILVVPPNRNATVSGDTVSVAEPGDGRSKPSVDQLLESAAHAFGEGLIGVILTGTGTDGAAGAREVKA